MQSTRRTRRHPSATPFQDPLENYEAPVYDDELEQALGEGGVLSMRSTPMKTVSPDTSVLETLAVLDQYRIAAVLSVDDRNRLLGIFSERDVLTRVAGDFDNIKDDPISEHMTRRPIVVYETDSPATALCVLAGSGLRHVPIVDVNNQVLGIVSPQRMLEFLKEIEA